jgi:plastocyanin
MRLALVIGAVAFGGALTAAPASAASADVNIGGFAFSPSSVTINQGDTVTWHYAGPDTNHSVTSDPGQADSWDSDPGKSPTAADHPPGTTFARQFATPGTFTYFCKVHSNMHGTVVVKGGDGGPGPPPADTTPPTLSKVSAKAVKRPKPVVLRFTLSEDATVKVKGPKKASLTRAFTAGAHKVKLSTRKLKAGRRYKLVLTATDAAGNVSRPVTRSVRVK